MKWIDGQGYLFCFRGGVYDEFANKMGPQSFTCRRVSKISGEILLHGQKTPSNTDRTDMMA